MGPQGSLHRGWDPGAESRRMSRDPLVKHCVPREHSVFKMLRVWTLREISLENSPKLPSSHEPVKVLALFYSRWMPQWACLEGNVASDLCFRRRTQVCGPGGSSYSGCRAG